MHEEHVIGAERAIDDQLTAPVTVPVLLPQKILLRARDRIRDLGIVVPISVVRVRGNARQRNEIGNRWRHRTKKLWPRLPRAFLSNARCPKSRRYRLRFHFNAQSLSAVRRN